MRRREEGRGGLGLRSSLVCRTFFLLLGCCDGEKAFVVRLEWAVVWWEAMAGSFWS